MGPPDFPDNLKDFVKNDIETLQMELARIRTLLADHQFCPFVDSAQLHDLTERFGELDAICRYAARRRPDGGADKARRIVTRPWNADKLLLEELSVV